ncbi:hypothetical protein CDL15_Pgr011018 [Punica granatum]|uniref:EamA domain-containing protein n=1 Tax=Punica granatum TaxID=22663 RepID=A0A218XMQ5_PUNGR|nr:hypothetical protein CDL15_Pgr011018 [Punica granatum]
MASPWCRWPWKTTSCSATTTLGNFSSHVRRHRISFSLPDPSSSSSCAASASTSKSGAGLKKVLNLAAPSPKSISSISEIVAEDASVPKLIRPRRRKSPSLRSLFGKRSLWRRILFASRKVRSIILLNLLTVVYASDIPVLKEVEAIMDPAAFSAVRFVVSAIPFIPFVFRARDAQTRNAGLELGLWVSLGYIMQALGLLTSDAGRASFINMFTVIVVPLVQGMLGAAVPAYTWAGAFMSVVGVGMLESSGSPPCVGDLFNLLSAVFFGVHILRTEHISRTMDKKSFLPLLGYESTIQESGASWTWAMVWESLVEFPWIPALYTGVFSTGLCLWLEMVAMRDVSAAETAIVYGLEPVWGAGFAWFLLGERWGTVGWIGATFVLGGSLMVQIYGSSTPKKLNEGNNMNRNSNNQLLVTKDRSGFSSSPVIVRSKKDFPDLLNKYESSTSEIVSSGGENEFQGKHNNQP